MTTFRSNGKLLITAEYLVLDGVKALALPTKFGQSLTVEPIKEKKLFWKSIDHDGHVWFEKELSVDSLVSSFNDSENLISKRLFEILISAKQLNPNFLNTEGGFNIITKLEFPKNWGLGSSSTLINNIANWANVNAFELLSLTFGGSGYDIACAQNNSSITYINNNDLKLKTIEPVEFNPIFKEGLFFVYLNQKQNSREGIKHYESNKTNAANAIIKINSITENIVTCQTISEFETLILKHEQIISNLVKLPTVKSLLFPDYSRAIKSLGAWGGDFILATGNLEDMEYFKNKGFDTIVPYRDMIL